MDSAQDSYKKWGIVLIIFLLIFIPSEIGLTRPNALENLKLKFQTTFSEKPKVTVLESRQIVQAQIEDHPKLYFVDLEYDPKTGKVIKKGSGYSNGDMAALASKPSSSSGIFNYRIETIPAKNEAPLSGWVYLYETVISTEDGKYQFRTSIPYIFGETLNIHLINNQKIWEEKVR